MLTSPTCQAAGRGEPNRAFAHWRLHLPTSKGKGERQTNALNIQSAGVIGQASASRADHQPRLSSHSGGCDGSPSDAQEHLRQSLHSHNTRKLRPQMGDLHRLI